MSTLEKERFLIAEDDNESFEDYIPNPVVGPKNLNLLRILLTNKCNLNCKYCKVMPNIKNEMRPSVQEKVLKKVISCFFKNSITASSPKTIHITGGEPMIYWGRIKYIVGEIERQKRKNERLKIVIGTNGILLDKKKACFIKKHNIKVIVSIDGRKHINDRLRLFKNGRGSFDQTINGLKKLKEAGVDIGLSMVVGKHNIDTLEQEISFLKERFSPLSFGVNYMKPPTELQNDFPFLVTPLEYVRAVYNAHKKFRPEGLFFELVFRQLLPFVERKFRYYDCGAAAGSTINVDSSGNIGPCKSFLVLDKLSEKIKSNININRVLMKRCPLFKQECQECEAIGICGNGCAYQSWIRNNDLLGLDSESCEYVKNFYSLFLKDLYEQIKGKLAKREFYISTQEDRAKLLGKVRIDDLNLNSSIGHATKEYEIE
ncbi:MAG: radical SAM protein [Candidatus Hodarchaeales archaeon]